MSRLALIATGILWLSCSALARAEQPLYEVDPYDQITVHAASDNKVYKIVPLDLPRRQPPNRGRPNEKLVVHLFDSPDKEYAVEWRSIVKLELFEQLVLDKANALVAAGYHHGQFDGALALLRELHGRNPRYTGLDNTLGAVTDKLVDSYVKEQDYPAARMLLRELAAEYSEHPVMLAWRERLTSQAAPLLADARSAADSGQWRKAGESMRQVAVIWPELPGARDLAKTIHRKYPRVVVGVGNLAGEILPGHFDDWTARRTSRLLYRTLTEFAGAGTEGGKYDCPVGVISSEGLGHPLHIKLNAGVCWADGKETLNNIDVSRRLLAMADPHDPAYRIDWADLLMAVSIHGVYDLDVELRRPHVRPEAMLQIALTPQGVSPKPGEPPPVNGPFVVASRPPQEMASLSPQEMVFTANAHYFAAEKGQPKEIVERRYPSLVKAISALKRGEIHVLDRVNPWDVAALRAESNVIVQPYALPLVHCLIPNVRRPLLSDRTFRRALAYGIVREAILQQMLGGIDVPGCMVTSSPFPMGVDPGDPMGYASDDSIVPRKYEPRLTIALANRALQGYIDAKKAERANMKKLPTLVLAYPPDEIATAVCASIQKQLKMVDIPIELRAIEGPLPTRVPDDVDLMYAELPMSEPLVDARRVLGEEGMTGGCSSCMTLALRQLDEAVDWGQARECLHRIHRIAYDDAAVLPLWQLVEYFAYHNSLRGMAAKPVSLYQNVEQWQPPFQYPAEK